MPRSGPPSYTFTLSPGYLAVPGAVITSSQWNVTLQDIQTTFNGTQPIVLGGTGATSAAGARTNLGLVPGVDIPSLTSANVWTNTNTFQLTDAGAGAGPDLILDRLSASPAANDIIGEILFTGRDSGAATQTYSVIRSTILDPVAATEDGQLQFQNVVAGTVTTQATLNSTAFTIVPPLTISSLSAALTVANGGTGLATLTANNVILGNGTSNPTFVAPGTSGNVLTSNGTIWASAAPVLGGMTLLQTFTTTSGTTQSLTSIAAGYIELYFEFDGVSFTTNVPAIQLAVSSTNGGAYGTAQSISVSSGGASGAISGFGRLGGMSSATRNQTCFTETGLTVGAYTHTATGLTTNTSAVVNAIQFSGGTFDAGTIKVWGVK